MSAAVGSSHRDARPGRTAAGSIESRAGPEKAPRKKGDGQMTWEIFYMVCFTLGLSLTVLSALGVFSHLHFGHFHLGHAGHSHIPHLHGHGSVADGKAGISPVNGFTIAAFLCWFGGCGYLLSHYGNFVMPIVLGVSTITGLAGAAI